MNREAAETWDFPGTSPHTAGWGCSRHPPQRVLRRKKRGGGSGRGPRTGCGEDPCTEKRPGRGWRGTPGLPQTGKMQQPEQTGS